MIFLLPLFSLPPSLKHVLSLQKFIKVWSFVNFITFYPYSFDCIKINLFVFQFHLLAFDFFYQIWSSFFLLLFGFFLYFSWLFSFSITFLIIWFHFIFISILVLIIFNPILLIVFQLYPSLFGLLIIWLYDFYDFVFFDSIRYDQCHGFKRLDQVGFGFFYIIFLNWFFFNYIVQYCIWVGIFGGTI